MVLASFGVIALAAKDIGKFCTPFGLPLISGFLLAGVLAGPYVLGIVGTEAPAHLRFVDHVALAFIAFAAGGELNVPEVREHLRSIVSTIIGQLLVVIPCGTIAFIVLAQVLPFMQGIPPLGVFAVAIIGATIMLARSPSSAYAIIRELRAKGPITRITLGVTVLSDAVVILVFATGVSVGAVLLEGARFNVAVLLFLVCEIALDIGLGLLVGRILGAILSHRVAASLKTVLILLTGYSIFFLSATLREVHLGPLAVHIFSEPLLVGLVAGFVVTNYTSYKAEFHKVVEDTAPFVLVIFFTSVGIAMELDVIARTWEVAVGLLLVRLLGMFLGTCIGGVVAGNPLRHNAILGLTFVTQAGVSVGLAKEVAVEFPTWGSEFATLIIAIIVINQIIGPPLLKWAIHLAGEAHARAEIPGFDGIHDVVIFGVDDQALALARQLKAHGWQVQMADTEAKRLERLSAADVAGHVLADFSLDSLRLLPLDKADAIVTMLDDISNYAICEIAYEHFGTRHLVVRLQDRANIECFAELGALIVEPGTAMVGLLDHFVRSPAAASLLLGQEENQDVMEVVVYNRSLHGMVLRDLRLPADVLILSIRRHGHFLITHGYTRLELGDEVTVVGTPQSLQEMQWRFESSP